MDWKQILINSLTALVVAVVSGIAVWGFTHDTRQREGLTYEVTSGGSFGSGESQLTFFNVSIRNEGTKRADDVNFRLTSPEGLSLDQAQVRYHVPRPGNVTYSINRHSLFVEIPNFLPSDRVILSLLYKGASSGKPSVQLRSANGIGTERAASGGNSVNNPLFLFLGLSVFAAIPFAARIALRKLISRVGPDFDRSRNNSGFLLFHAGLVQRANVIFEHAIDAGETGPITLSNLAATKAYLGDFDSSDKLMRVARAWSSGKRSTAITLFNQFLCSFQKGRVDRAKLALKVAISKGKFVKDYCERSDLVRDIYAKDPSVKSIVDAT